MSRQAVSKWERAEASPDTENLILLARLYGVTIDELLRTEGAFDSQDSGISLKKDDYGYKSEPLKEVVPDNYTDKEVYPNQNPEENVSSPQGSPFGADIGEEEKKSADFMANVEKAGRAIGDAINAAGKKLNEKAAEGDWEDKLENGAEKFAKGVEKGMDKFYQGLEKGMNKVERKLENDSSGYSGSPKGGKTSATLFDKIFPIIITALFFCTIGIGLAHPGWTLFLLIPLYYTGKEAIRRRNPMVFCYPVFCVYFYCSIGGFFDTIFPLFSDNWYGLMWLIFLTIPLYYTIFPAIKKRNPLIFCYPVLCLIVYLGFGILLDNLWSAVGEAWLCVMWAPLALTIPLYYIVISHFRNKKKAAGQSV